MKRKLILCGLALLYVMAVHPAFANGGQIRVSNEPAGPYVITVFTSPSPFRAGPVDISVFVAEGQDLVAVQNAQVTITTEPIDHRAPGGSYPATHDQATNKQFYAAKFTLPSDGRWRIVVEVGGALGRGSTSFEVEAGAASALSTPVLVVLLALVPLGIAWRLAQAQRQRLRPTPSQEQS